MSLPRSKNMLNIFVRSHTPHEHEVAPVLGGSDRWYIFFGKIAK